MRRRCRRRIDRGFTLTEALLSVVLLALMATVISAIYYSGLYALRAQEERMLLDSALRSRMELLLSTRFDLLTSGTDTVTVNGRAYTITWTVTPSDLDGDGVAEATAKTINVSLAGRSLTTLFVDPQGELAKI